MFMLELQDRTTHRSVYLLVRVGLNSDFSNWFRLLPVVDELVSDANIRTEVLLKYEVKVCRSSSMVWLLATDQEVPGLILCRTFRFLKFIF